MFWIFQFNRTRNIQENTGFHKNPFGVGFHIDDPTMFKCNLSRQTNPKLLSDIDPEIAKHICDISKCNALTGCLMLYYVQFLKSN